MDINRRKVVNYYINHYLKDIMSKKLILKAKYVFLSWGVSYFDPIFWYFYEQFMRKTHLYQKIIVFYSILYVIIAVFGYFKHVRNNIISYQVIYWLKFGVFIIGYHF